MIHCDIINVTLECVTLAILCVMMVSAYFRRRTGWLNRLFLGTVALHALNTTGDLLAWIFTAQPDIVSRVLTSVGNFVTYAVAPIAYLAFSVLAGAVITGKDRLEGRTAKIIAAVMVILTALGVILTFVNYAVPVLYTIDAENVFTWGPWRTLPDNLSEAQFILAFILVVLECGGNRRYVSHAILVFWIPLTAFVVINFTPVLMLAYPAVAIGLLIVYMEMQYAQDRKLAKKELETAVNRNRMLLGQIEPHFVANSLLAIEQLCVENPVIAKNTVKAFAKYLRENFYAMDREGMVSLEEELDHVRSYLILELADPENSLEVTIDVDPDVARKPVPPLTVQPLVENAVRHGIGQRAGDGHVSIRATLDPQGQLIVIVADNGVGFDPKTLEAVEPGSPTGRLGAGRSIGLANVRERLALTCGGTLAVESSDSGTRVTMTVPKNANKKEEGLYASLDSR